jgi:ribonuclease HI
MRKKPPASRPAQPPDDASPRAEVTLYTDGGCKRNPGPGGYGAVIIDHGKRRELSGGFRLTTNNRMELTACIVALQALAEPAAIVLHSDSRYVVNGIEKGWAKKWRSNGWMRTPEEPALNADLWSKLLEECARHRVRFVWVRGHAGNQENERCDRLASEAILQGRLPDDAGYLAQVSQNP